MNADSKQNRSYTHLTEPELVEAMDASLALSALNGGVSQQDPIIPDSAWEFTTGL
jgi:hypothetical protein